jgi:hypothetical protein
VRGWLYGDCLPTPFMPGERALLRSPIVRDEAILANTNEEFTVVEIERDEHAWRVAGRRGLPGWAQTIPTWKMKLRRDDDGGEFEAEMVRATHAYDSALRKIASEAGEVGERDLHRMKQYFGNFQSVYARTVHTAQGETHKHTFLDVADIRQRAKGNPLEAQQLAYVGATRPTTSLILAGGVMAEIIDLNMARKQRVKPPPPLSLEEPDYDDGDVYEQAEAFLKVAFLADERQTAFDFSRDDAHQEALTRAWTAADKAQARADELWCQLIQNWRRRT